MHFFLEGEDEPPRPFYSKAFITFVCADAVKIAIALQSSTLLCDAPLKLWLLGGVFLGFPVTWLIHRFKSQQPRFRYYRLKVLEIRNRADPRSFRMEGLRLYGRSSKEYNMNRVNQEHVINGCCHWRVTFDQPSLVTAYRLVTAQSAPRDLDPTRWTLEASTDGANWKLIDGPDNDLVVPSERGKPTSKLGDLLHLTEAPVFRFAFVLEVLADLGALSWLMAGTSWVIAGSETCINSAPLLWWSSFFMVSVAWALVGTGTVFIIVGAVVTVIASTKSKRPE